MTLKFFTAAFALGFVALSSPGLAQNAQKCGPRDDMLSTLASTYGETRQSIGLGSNNTVIEVFASTETGSWSIIITTPNGLSCLVASGQAFETLAEALPRKGTKT